MSKRLSNTLAMLRMFCSTVLLFCLVQACVGYSVLTHEEIVDLLWKDQIQPLLMKRYPGTTEADLKKAHAFAYGGSLLQDMGYYPFGSKYFSDLVHYVRTGDFVEALLEQSNDVNEYAFALGALAHYAADVNGHPAINQSVAILFPKLHAKFGNEVTYADDPKAHIRTEFGFDMVQVAKNRYTSDRYHDFIGFEVSKPVMERAFMQTYGLKMSDVSGSEDLAIGSFRRAVSRVIPEMTRVALLSRNKAIIRDTPNINEKKFLYHLSRADYQKEWGKGYRKPGFGTRILAFFLKIVPKVGPFKAISFQIPTTQTEDMYIKSINNTLDNYAALLRETKNGKLQLRDLDFDTARETKPGEYPLADDAYARLLDDLDKRHFSEMTPELQQNILAFYANVNGPMIAKKAKKKEIKKAQAAWEKTSKEIADLKAWQLPMTTPDQNKNPEKKDEKTPDRTDNKKDKAELLLEPQELPTL
ncbi:MAG: zinc dependent phospholipase C family protein [Acidobacteriota bacterium]|nr:zinc dependent phospholipase C family protein [Acidobacteriota bacterium]